MDIKRAVIVCSTVICAFPFLGHAARQVDPSMPPANILKGLLTQTERELHGITLTSIVISRDKKHAMINGKTTKEGETINGYKVTNINEKSIVVIDSGGNTYTVNSVKNKKSV